MRLLKVSCVAVLLLPASLLAQQTATPMATMPKVGDMAPDFTLPAATVKGIAKKPLTLSSLRGQTVVLAFYPKQRSSGCTIQMHHYRDAYKQIFNNGKKVALLAISVDPVKDIASWAKQDNFPFTFLSDADGVAGHEYATLPAKGRYEQRVVFVIDPKGRITSVMDPFNEVDATAYDVLTKDITDAKGMK